MSTEAELRQSVVDKARSYLGCKESDGSHKKIIDLYNSHTPLARGYAVTYTDAWCATFASAVAIALGLTDIIPPECGCDSQIALFKALGRWNEDGTIAPGIADYIYYNWDDSTQPNDGGADHVGIVTAVSGSTITVIEGNCSDAVCERSISKGWGYVRGYAQPDYASKADGSTATATDKTTAEETTSVTASTYTVVKGDTLWAIAAKLLGNGTRYKELMALNSLTSTVIHAGQVLVLSGASDAESEDGTVASTDTSEITYTVVKGDTLWKIAKTYLGSGPKYKEIMALNELASTTIRVGQVLKIPKS